MFSIKQESNEITEDSDYNESSTKTEQIEDLSNVKINTTQTNPSGTNDQNSIQKEITCCGTLTQANILAKPFKYDVCSTFIQSSNLNVDPGIQSQEKTYQCKVCLTVFTQLSSLNPRTYKGFQRAPNVYGGGGFLLKCF